MMFSKEYFVMPMIGSGKTKEDARRAKHSRSRGVKGTSCRSFPGSQFCLIMIEADQSTLNYIAQDPDVIRLGREVHLDAPIKAVRALKAKAKMQSLNFPELITTGTERHLIRSMSEAFLSGQRTPQLQNDADGLAGAAKQWEKEHITLGGVKI